MSLPLLLCVLLRGSPDGFEPPPMVSAEPAPPPPPMVAAQPAPPPASRPQISRQAERAEPDDVPLYEVHALATASSPSVTAWSGLTAGLRGEVDVFRFGLVASWDHFLSPAFTISDSQVATVLLGYAPLASHLGRLRLMAGLDVRAASAVSAGPVFAVTGRVGLGLLGFDAAATLTPLPFRRLDVRAAVVLRGGLFELQGGYRLQWLDTTDGGTLGTMLATTADAGPYLALGISL